MNLAQPEQTRSRYGQAIQTAFWRDGEIEMLRAEVEALRAEKKSYETAFLCMTLLAFANLGLAVFFA